MGGEGGEGVFVSVHMSRRRANGAAKASALAVIAEGSELVSGRLESALRVPVKGSFCMPANGLWALWN